MKKRIFRPLAGLLFFSLLFSSCKKPLDGIEISVEPAVMKYTALLQVYDAADASVPTGVTISFSGADTKDIYDLSGKKTFVFEKGFLPIGLAPSRKPAGNIAITVSALINAPGYLPVNKKVSFREGNFEQVLDLPLVKITNSPKGSSAFTASYDLVNNSLPNALSFATPLSGEKAEQATVTVPYGTVFRDRNNNAITGSALSVQAVHFDTKNIASLNCFPGGLMPDSVRLQDGTQSPGAFISAGFVSIDFNIGNTPVKKFDRPINVSVSADPELVNPETAQKIQPGDQIPVWSYNVEEGLWKFETTGTFQSVNGKLQVDFATSHLTWFNLGWFRSTCNRTQDFTIGGASETNEAYQMVLYTPYSTTPLTSLRIAGIRGGKIGFLRAPDMNVRLRIYRRNEFNSFSNLQTAPYTEVPSINLCSAGGTIDFPEDNRQTISLEVVGVCTAKDVEIRPTGYVWYRDVTPGAPVLPYRPLFVQKGMLVTKELAIGHTYAVEAKWGTTKFAFTKKLEKDQYTERVTLSGNLCNGF